MFIGSSLSSDHPFSVAGESRILIAFTRVLLAYTGIFTFLVSILNTWALVAQCNSVMPPQYAASALAGNGAVRSSFAGM